MGKEESVDTRNGEIQANCDMRNSVASTSEKSSSFCS